MIWKSSLLTAPGAVFVVTLPSIAGMLSGVPNALDTSESVYSEVLGSGILRFDSELVDFDDNMFVGNSGIVSELKDINNDGIADLVLGYQLFERTIQYALGGFDDHGMLRFHRFVPRKEIFYDGMTAADLDGNGWPELIAVTNDSIAISIYWIEDGEIQYTTVEFSEDLGYESELSEFYLDFRVTVRGGNLDGDQRSDLVFNSSGQKVVVRWSSGTKGDELVSYDAPMLSDQNALYPVQDYDGDGDGDILLLDSLTESFFFFRGNGSGSLDPVEIIDLPMSGFVQDLSYPSFGQLDSDPALDLVLYDAMTDQTVILANFATDLPTKFPMTLGSGERIQCIPGDIDQSGFDDLLVTGVDPLSNGAGTVQEKWLLFDPLGPESYRVQIETGNASDVAFLQPSISPRNLICAGYEFNGDGLTDLLWMSTGTFYKTLYDDESANRAGIGFMVSPQLVDSSNAIKFGANQYEAHPEAFHMLPNDFNSDDISELLLIGDGVAKNFGLVDHAPVLENVAGLNNAFMSVAADLGGDGSSELVASRVGLGMVIKTVDSEGVFSQNFPVLNPNGNAYLGVDAADYDSDGRDDIFAIDWTSDEVHVYRGIDDSEVALTSVIPLNEQIRSIKPGLADVNGDGSPDLLVGVEDGLRVFEHLNTIHFLSSRMIQLRANPYWIVPTDMDNDGVTDLVMATTGGTFDDGIAVVYMNSDGTVSEEVYLQKQNSILTNEVVVGDFNSDGLPDLVASKRAGFGLQNTVSNTHRVWIQEDPRRFMVHAILPSPDTFTVGTSDMNQDGFMDVITASDYDDSVRIHWGQAGAGAGCPADLNGDGVLDFFDISAFLSGEPDFNGDGGFDFFDISAFLTAYAAGCA